MFFLKINVLLYSQTVAMKFILKHGKSDKDIENLRQEIEVSFRTNIAFFPLVDLFSLGI